MIRIDSLNENQVLTIIVSGQLTKADYTQLLPKLEKLFGQHDRLRFYIKLENFTGFDTGALWEDIKFDFKHKSHYGKTAIVGNKKWQDWGTRIADLFFSAEMKFFYTAQSGQAWDWVNR